MNDFKPQNKEIIKETNKLFETYNGINVLFRNKEADKKFFNKLYIGQDIGIFDYDKLSNTMGHIINYDVHPDKTIIKSLYNNVTVTTKKNHLYYNDRENCYIGSCIYDAIDKRGNILKNITETDAAFDESEKNHLIKKQLNYAMDSISYSPFCSYDKTRLREFIKQVEDFYKIK